ncbi:hypothetical protein BDL97_16G057700 [Sphagnum fallax]|nr:hypothetical protein BDL97_16G057700 [Sphagnum fallax]
MEVVVSAPGKVLITGAYLVLERPNAGLVLSTSARFYAIVRPIHSDVAPDSWSWYLGGIKLAVHGESKEEETELELVHMVSQAAHCAAQGKVGSGFDVSCAVFGSQRYVRFSPSVLLSAQAGGRLVTPLELVKQVLTTDWDAERLPYALPPGLVLMVGEPGFGGSHTPSMVGAVQAWRKADPGTANPVWVALAEANQGVERGLLHLMECAESRHAYNTVLEGCCTSSFDKWKYLFGDTPERLEIVEALLETRQAFINVRSLLRHVGEAANVPIEPPSQTALLDATMDMSGVLLAGVPGAGGFDAVFAVVLGNTVREQVDAEWSRRGVLSLSVQEDPQGVSLELCDPRIDRTSS